MKNIIYIISILFLVVSCTEKIDIDLNSSDPQIVIEGSVSTNEVTIIKLSNSVNFDESNTFPKVEGAIVELSDNLGHAEMLHELSPGMYSTSTLTGVVGGVYSLSVQKDGKILKSTSTIPNQVAFDTLIIIKTDETGGGGPGGMGKSSTHDLVVGYFDPADEVNYYRFVELVNGKMISSYVFDDRITNGSYTRNPLISFDRTLTNGDTLQVIMQCIDENIYDYFSSFGNLMGGPGNSSTPANPYTNIEGGVLGYFSAHTGEVKQVIIQ